MQNYKYQNGIGLHLAFFVVFSLKRTMAGFKLENNLIRILIFIHKLKGGIHKLKEAVNEINTIYPKSNFYIGDRIVHNAAKCRMLKIP